MNTPHTRHGWPLERRFWRKVSIGDECWEWTASRTLCGYGQIQLSNLGEPVRMTRAHRASWIIHNGPIPPGLFVCHHCDNPPCVRPDHLWLGTHAENVADMHRKGRASGGRTSRPGELHPLHKLTLGQVQQIREKASSGATGRQLAHEFGISTAQISRIKNGTRWANQ